MILGYCYLITFCNSGLVIINFWEISCYFRSPEVVATEADARIQSTSEDILEAGQSNSEAASLQWDDYDHESELSFKKIN